MPSPTSAEAPVKKRTILLASVDDDRLVKLAERQPFATPHAVARLALRLGLAELERDAQIMTRSPTAVTT